MTRTFYFLFCLIGLALAQTSLSNCPCSYQFRPICYGSNRYINQCVATCANSANSSNLLPVGNNSCNGVSVAHTITSSGKNCYCPLITDVVCVGNVPYPNPCFAKCELPSTNYGDYHNCPSNVSLSNITSSSLYPMNVTCNCLNNYSPVCIGTLEYSNLCLANCYQRGATTATCLTQYNFAQQATNPDCVCIYSIQPVCIQGKRYANSCLAQCDYPNGIMMPC